MNSSRIPTGTCARRPTAADKGRNTEDPGRVTDKHPAAEDSFASVALSAELNARGRTVTPLHSDGRHSLCETLRAVSKTPNQVLTTLLW